MWSTCGHPWCHWYWWRAGTDDVALHSSARPLGTLPSLACQGAGQACPPQLQAPLSTHNTHTDSTAISAVHHYIAFVSTHNIHTDCILCYMSLHSITGLLFQHIASILTTISTIHHYIALQALLSTNIIHTDCHLQTSLQGPCFDKHHPHWLPSPQYITT